jgi:uncharacterized protein YjbI with pentapeptide repeats
MSPEQSPELAATCAPPVEHDEACPWSYLHVISAGTEYNDLSVVGESLAAAEPHAATFVHCRFDGVDFAGAQLGDVTFERCSLAGCDLSNADLSDTSFDIVTISDSKLLGATFAGATLRSLQVRDSPSTLTSFFRASIRDTSFVGCDLSEADLREARIVQSAIVRCNLSSTSFVGAEVRQLDIRGSSLDGSVPLTQCGGFVLDTTQIVPLATAVIRDVGARVDDAEIPDLAELPGGRQVGKLVPIDRSAAQLGLQEARERLRTTGTASADRT